MLLNLANESLNLFAVAFKVQITIISLAVWEENMATHMLHIHDHGDGNQYLASKAR